MSDPVSNHDIEDVLSSIRRLVAQGDPKAVENAQPEPVLSSVKNQNNATETNSSDAPSAAGKLVLTPAFRVNPSVDASDAANSPAPTRAYDAATNAPESDVIPTKDPRPIPAPAESPSERASLEATIAELEAAVNSRDGEFEPDGSEDQVESSLPTAFLHKLDAVKLRGRPVELDDDVEIDTDDHETDHAEAGPEGIVTSAVSNHISDAIANQIADAFPRWNAANEGPLRRDTTDTPADDSEIDTAADASTTESVVVELPRERAPEASVDVEEVAAVEAESMAEPEVLHKPFKAPDHPDHINDDIISPTFRHASLGKVYDPVAEATADAAETAPDAGDIYGDELTPDPQTAVATPQTGQLMDPDMVRDMVGQMIREELQGEMGERITRNVRKLVRREINRVLSAQEFN